MSDDVEETSRVAFGRSSLRSAVLLVGLNVLGALGTIVSLALSRDIVLVVLLFLFSVLALVWAAVFSVREEPIQRLVNLIKALRRRGR